MTVTTTVTKEGHFSFLASLFQSQECLEQFLKLPYPSHPGPGGESETTLTSQELTAGSRQPKEAQSRYDLDKSREDMKLIILSH